MLYRYLYVTRYLRAVVDILWSDPKYLTKRADSCLIVGDPTPSRRSSGEHNMPSTVLHIVSLIMLIVPVYEVASPVFRGIGSCRKDP